MDRGIIGAKMKNTCTKHNRTAIKDSVLLYVGTTTIPAKGKIVRAGSLHGAYCKRPNGVRLHVSQEKFYRILNKRGYRRRPDIRGDYYQDLAFTN